MKAEARQRKILALLEREAGIAAEDLANRLQVSRMTVSRDLRQLCKRGLLRRIHGGAVVMKGGGRVASGPCKMCGSPLLPHQYGEIYLPDGSVEYACCTLCALKHHSARSRVDRLELGDQLSGRRLVADEAFFLINSLATPCCQPSILSFADMDGITLFQAGFGGSIARFAEAVEFLRVAQKLETG